MSGLFSLFFWRSNPMNPTITPLTDGLLFDETIDAATAVRDSIVRLLGEARAQVTVNKIVLGNEDEPITKPEIQVIKPARTVADWVELMRTALPSILSDGKTLAAHDISSAVLRLHPLRQSEANDGLIRVNAAKNVLTDKGFLVRKKVIGGTFLYQLAK